MYLNSYTVQKELIYILSSYHLVMLQTSRRLLKTSLSLKKMKWKMQQSQDFKQNSEF